MLSLSSKTLATPLYYDSFLLHLTLIVPGLHCTMSEMIKLPFPLYKPKTIALKPNLTKDKKDKI